MSTYDDCLKRVNDILDDKTEIKSLDHIPANDNLLTYKNGIKAWVGALFLDMRNSTDYFIDNKPDIVARVIRAFYSEIIGILKEGDFYREIGIRGDCIYAIYDANKKKDLNEIFDKAVRINSFQDMFQKNLRKKGFPTFSIGIGLGASKNLIIKAGQSGSGINNLVWIGEAVVHASKLSEEGNDQDGYAIYMDSTFYSNIMDFTANESKQLKNKDLLNETTVDDEIVYCGNVIKTDFSNWIKGKFKQWVMRRI